MSLQPGKFLLRTLLHFYIVATSHLWGKDKTQSKFHIGITYKGVTQR